MVLVDRNEELLRASAGSLGVECELVVADLTVEADVARVEEWCGRVDLLVNNAGFGHRREFLETPVAEEVAMCRLQTEVVLRLTMAALPGMAGRGRGSVVNTASVLGFFPSSTYSATKSWVVNFSLAAARSVRPSNVDVMALCPGFTRTDFHDSARMDMSGIPKRLWLDADFLVAKALRDLRKGKALSVPGWQYKVIVACGRAVPLGLLQRVLTWTGKGSLAAREG